MLHKLTHCIENLAPLAKTVLMGGFGISAAMLFAAFLMTVFPEQTCRGYLIYLAAKGAVGSATVVSFETVACTLFIHTYIVKYVNGK